MIKKIILIILLVTILPIKVNANFWDAVGACFTDPCNCGDSNKHRQEYWGGVMVICIEQLIGIEFAHLGIKSQEEIIIHV